jgi:hypothetical protein
MTYEEEAIARSAIGHTQSIYNSAGDRGKVEDIVTAFAPDGVLDIVSTTYTGHDAIKAFITDVAAGDTSADLAGSRHHLTTSRIEFDGDNAALGWTYFFVMRRGMAIQEGTYIDRYRKIGGRWLITHRRVKMLFDTAS